MCWNTPGIYKFTLVYTSFIQSQKVCITAGFEPMTSCILARCLNPSAASMIVKFSSSLCCISYCLAHLGADVVRLVQDLQRPPPQSKVWSQLCGCTLVPSERFHSRGHVLFNLKVRTTWTWGISQIFWAARVTGCHSD